MTTRALGWLVAGIAAFIIGLGMACSIAAAVGGPATLTDQEISDATRYCAVYPEASECGWAR